MFPPSEDRIELHRVRPARPVQSPYASFARMILSVARMILSVDRMILSVARMILLCRAICSGLPRIKLNS
jgi:hypothetical protein